VISPTRLPKVIDHASRWRAEGAELGIAQMGQDAVHGCGEAAAMGQGVVRGCGEAAAMGLPQQAGRTGLP
jgi:hypothetical protein